MGDEGRSRHEPSPSQAPAVPLCVDLDGTLVRGDLLAESLLRLVRRSPLLLLRLPVWLARGRARLKREVAERVAVEPAALPYDDELLAHLRRERAAGRRLVLVTASHRAPARAVADHLALFDEVLATDGERNLKGRAKRDELVRRFGRGGYDYAGDSAADLAVWDSAREAIAVNAPPSVVRRLGARATAVLGGPRRPLGRAVLGALRVRQWVKNLLIFIPAITAHRLHEPALAGHALIAFVAFGLGASAVYVLNDMLDVEADRLHPVKRRRPFASGELALPIGFALFPLLVLGSLGAALALPAAFLGLLALYFLLTTAYSLVLKELPLVDVIVLAGLYTMRIIAGSAATGVPVTEWLLAFSMFIFLSLGALKRYAELLRVRSQAAGPTKVERRGYYAGDLELMVPMGLASGYLSVLVLALYISSDKVAALYARPSLLWFACPLILYWISRMWLLAHRGLVQDDPLAFAVRDRVTWIVGALGAAILLAAARWPA
jgi:4-hydroxybenzoate polyprenyltransferase/phosphoserine phosphatase